MNEKIKRNKGEVLQAITPN